LDILHDYGYGISLGTAQIRTSSAPNGGGRHRQPGPRDRAGDRRGIICLRCEFSDSNGRWEDTMKRGEEKISKQAYNDRRDRGLWGHLELANGNRMTVREY
jgi:hypothetical protein